MNLNFNSLFQGGHVIVKTEFIKLKGGIKMSGILQLHSIRYELAKKNTDTSKMQVHIIALLIDEQIVKAQHFFDNTPQQDSLQDTIKMWNDLASLLSYRLPKVVLTALPITHNV